MAPRTSKKAPPKSKTQQQESDAVDLIESLASKLEQLGPRKWKVEDLEKALSKAASGLADKGLQAHIAANLQRCAAALHERLVGQAGPEAQQQQQQQHDKEQQQQQQQAAKRAKRGSKKAAAAAAAVAPAAEAPEEPPELPPAHPPSLSTAAGYAELAAGQEAGQLDARFSPAALLLARSSPGDALVLAHVRRVAPGAAAGAEAAMGAARAALGVCAALSSEAAGPEDALRAFGPAIGLLNDALQQLRPEQQAGPGEQASPPGLLGELRQLAGRAMASMHAALLQQQLVLSGRGPALRAAAYWRANPRPVLPAAAAEAACAAAASACVLLTELHLRDGAAQAAASGRGLRARLEPVGAAAAADLRHLAPYACSGLLAHLAGQSEEDACSSSGAAHLFLALYSGASKLEAAEQQDYLARLAAARKAAAVARHLGEDALAALIAEEACALPVSQEFVGWLQEQPPSSIVAAALDASRGGLSALSKHIVQECSERAVQGLLAAMQRSGAAAASASGAGAGSEAEGGTGGAEPAMDDLLFFADKEGDASMFGRDWHLEEEEEEESEEEEPEGDGRSLHLGSLPGGDGQEGGGRLSVDLGDE